jgi:hypothetical protein
MAFLGLTDLKFKSPEKRKDNKVNSTLKYPLNLGSAERGHYVVFHVNEQVILKPLHKRMQNF